MTLGRSIPSHEKTRVAGQTSIIRWTTGNQSRSACTKSKNRCMQQIPRSKQLTLPSTKVFRASDNGNVERTASLKYRSKPPTTTDADSVAGYIAKSDRCLPVPPPLMCSIWQYLPILILTPTAQSRRPVTFCSDLSSGRIWTAAVLSPSNQPLQENHFCKSRQDTHIDPACHITTSSCATKTVTPPRRPKLQIQVMETVKIKHTATAPPRPITQLLTSAPRRPQSVSETALGQQLHQPC